MISKLGFVLNYNNKILSNRIIFRIANISCALLRSTLKSSVNFLHITVLGIAFDLRLIELMSCPKSVLLRYFSISFSSFPRIYRDILPKFQISNGVSNSVLGLAHLTDAG